MKRLLLLLALFSLCFSFNITDVILREGYPYEKHIAHADDGFELVMVRMPHGVSTVSRNATRNRPVVLLMHGLLDDCATWVVNLPHQSLGFILADLGYDVWMGNVRGNSYSMDHRNLTQKDEDYWFSIDFDNMIKYDMHAMVDTALSVSGQKTLAYVGHSQGTLMAFGALGANKTLASLINVVVAMAPVAYLSKQRVPIFSYLAKAEVTVGLHWLGARNLLPPNWLMNLVGGTACKFTPWICKTSLGIFVGNNPRNLNSSRLPLILRLEPGGTSVQNVVHWSQMINSKRFQRFDYKDPKKNMNKYGVPYAPEYPIEQLSRSNGVPPIALLSGGADLLADPDDVAFLIQMLPADNKPILHHYEPNYNHIDFMWGMNANSFIYPQIIKVIAQYARAQ